ncbi:MAG: hypothetical protein LBM95_02580 [Lactobacillales bacterium]|jgi:ABC-type bacteriocin/lantibiotic exporter with double-glycine peptidase domain|nr:hypothetical protein [Lactobacillales bacterium]
MKFLSQQRMNLYKLGMIFYVVTLNILFYSSNNWVVILLATIANVLAILTIIGFIQFGRTRKKENRQGKCEEKNGN